LWVVRKKEGGRGMSVYAPATKAIAQRPLHELLHARRRIDECAVILRDIDELLARDDVSSADKLALLNERATTRINLLACQNIVAACEERMRIEAQLMQRRHGWLL
jgi:hypothetical protein